VGSFFIVAAYRCHYIPKARSKPELHTIETSSRLRAAVSVLFPELTMKKIEWMQELSFNNEDLKGATDV